MRHIAQRQDIKLTGIYQQPTTQGTHRCAEVVTHAYSNFTAGEGESIYRIAEKFSGRKFRDFALEQAFRSINFAICVLVFRVCIMMITISQINLCKFGQIAKNAKYKPRENFLLYGNLCVV